MSEERKYYYRILGLKPGASKDEIQSAYRELGQIYHPGIDDSMDTEIMFREIRVAYENLYNGVSAARWA
jgi:DnaJ-class molecular chaperone